MDLTLPDALTSVPVLAGAGAVLLALLIGVVLAVIHRRRRRHVDETPSLPEVDLHEVREEVAKQLQGRWNTLQRDFVDTPADTLRRADALIAEAMRERGYPAVEAEDRLRLLREHEPAHAERYAELRRSLEADEKEWDTERRRQVLLQTRTLFDALLRGERAGQPRLFAA